MKRKKVIAVIVSIVLVAGVTIGGVFGYKTYQQKKLVAEVTPVASVSTQYWGDENTSSGMVTNNSSQEVYLSDTESVSEVFVKEGDTVAVGDPLIAYDMESVNIQIKQKELEISNIENNIAIAQRKLDKLKATTPVDKTRPTVTTPVVEQQPEVPQTPETPQVPEKSETGAYNYVTSSTAPTNAKDEPDGSIENPYVFLCSTGAYVTGNYLNTLANEKKSAVFEIRKGDVEKGEVIASWTMNGAYMTAAYEDGAKYDVFTHDEKDDNDADDSADDSVDGNTDSTDDADA